MSHTCPGPGCAKDVAPDMLMCPHHWYQVPRPLQKAVWAAWKGGAGAWSPEHRAAIRAAIESIGGSFA